MAQILRFSRNVLPTGLEWGCMPSLCLLTQSLWQQESVWLWHNLEQSLSHFEWSVTCYCPLNVLPRQESPELSALCFSDMPPTLGCEMGSVGRFTPPRDSVRPGEIPRCTSFVPMEKCQETVSEAGFWPCNSCENTKKVSWTYNVS